MNAQRLLRIASVLQLLRVEEETLRVWNKEGFLPVAARVMNERHYTIGSINELLRKGARNFSHIPTVDDLLKGRLTLLPADEAMAAMNAPSYSVMLQRVTSGRLAVVKLRSFQTRYSLQSIQQYRRASSANNQDLIPRKTVLHILGVSAHSLWALIREGLLCDAPVSENLHLRPVTRDSLLLTLRHLLPDWIDPQDWLDDRLCSVEPLVPFAQALKMLQQDSAGLHRLMDDQVLLYIYKPARKTCLFLPESLAAYLENEPVVSRDEVALQFGVLRSTVTVWYRQGWLVCPSLGHLHGEEWDFTRTCLLAILQQALPPAQSGGGMNARAWYAWRVERNAPLLSVRAVSAALGCKYNDVVTLAESGALWGIRTPSGQWLFTEHQIKKARVHFRKG